MRELSFSSILFGIPLSLVLACAGIAAARGGEDIRGLQSDTVTVGGAEREVSYFVPGSKDGKLLPIVIYLHGRGDNMRHILGKGLMKSASSVWMDVAKRESFLVFYPLGAKGAGRRAKTGWNDCRSDAEGNPQLDDVEFVSRLIDFAAKNLNGDRKRVYVTGMSNGGHMAMRVAMEMSEEVAAVAPIVALLPKVNKCSPPSLPVPILMMHGTADPIAPFEGGFMAGGRGEVLSARDTADMWVMWNNLDNLPAKTINVRDEISGDNSRIIKHVRERSPEGMAVIAFEIQGAGHTEPSRAAKLNRILKRVQGNQNNDIEMAETIWEFFKHRSR